MKTLRNYAFQSGRSSSKSENSNFEKIIGREGKEIIISNFMYKQQVEHVHPRKVGEAEILKEIDIAALACSLHTRTCRKQASKILYIIGRYEAEEEAQEESSTNVHRSKPSLIMHLCLSSNNASSNHASATLASPRTDSAGKEATKKYQH